jgi:hypothetical protein
MRETGAAKGVAMSSAERGVSRLVLGTIAPVVGLLSGWWGSFALLGDSPWIGWAAATGLSIGIALDLTLLRRRLESLYDLPQPALAGIATFYSVMIYGFFMGFPVPNLLVAVGWGYVLRRRGAAEVRTAATSAAIIMLILCGVTASLAFNEPTIASQMRGMLALPFTPPMWSLWALAVFGGLALVAGAYSLTKAAAHWAIRGQGAESEQSV